MTKFFVAYAANPADRTAIDGIGHTPEEALLDAARGIVGQTATMDSLKRYYGDMSGAQPDEVEVSDFLVTEECTHRLYDYVKQNGGAISWDFIDGKVDLDVDPRDVDFVVDHVISGMEENEEYNDSPVANWDSAQEAVDIYVYEALNTDEYFDGDRPSDDQRRADILKDAAAKFAVLHAIDKYLVDAKAKAKAAA